MVGKYSEDEEKELNKQLNSWKRRAGKLILNDYFDSCNISELEFGILKQVTNAETHKDINWCMWNSGVIETALNNISDKIKRLKKSDSR